MSITKDKLDEWRKLAEAATPGPWFQTGEPWFHAEDGVLAGSDDGNIAFMIADCDTAMFCGEREEYEGPVKLSPAEDDAAFIVAAREAVPALIAALAEAEERGRVAEREECAKVADAHADESIAGDFWKGINAASREIARTIRARAKAAPVV